jgi:hypothetical protein
MKVTNKQIIQLRDALFYLQTTQQQQTAEFRIRGRGAWKPLTPESQFFNLAKYEHRLLTRRFWLRGDDIVCDEGRMSKKCARRILKNRNQFFSIAGWYANPAPDGGLTIGCQTFSKKEVEDARQLLK